MPDPLPQILLMCQDLGRASARAQALSGLGWRVVLADNEIDALSAVTRYGVDVAVLDLPAEISRRTREGDVLFVDIGLPPGKGAEAIVEKYGQDRVLLRDAATCPK